MNKVFFLILAITLVGCKGSSQEIKQISILTKCYEQKDEECFLLEFPENYVEFNNYFGWNQKLDSPQPLYENSKNYIDYFYSLLEDNKQYINFESKIISICKDGVWEADAVNYFQKGAIHYIEKNNRYELINNLKKDEAESILFFLFDSPHPKYNEEFISHLNDEKRQLINSLFKTKFLTKESANLIENFEKYNENYLVKEFDVTGDGQVDKIISSLPYQGEELLILKKEKENYNLSLNTINFSEDGGNIVNNIIPYPKNNGFIIETYFPDGGYYEIDYYIKYQNDSNWTLEKTIHKTKSDQSENAVKYVCTVMQNLNLNNPNFIEKIKPIPNEQDRDKICETVKNTNTRYYVSDSDGYSNLREKASSNSKIIQKVNSGNNVEVLEKNDDWWKISTEEGNVGYVHKSRIKIIE